MKNRLVSFLAPAALVAFLCLYTQPAMAQQSDLGQQGEFNGENVDTGAAALDTGPEAAEAPEVGVEKSPLIVRTAVAASGAPAATIQALGSARDLDAQGDFDLQEITETDMPGEN